MKKLSFCYLMILFCAFTCKNDTEVSPVALPVLRIKGGTSFGMCIGYCRTEIEVSSQKITMLRKPWGRGGNSDLPDKTCERTITTQEWTALVNAINANLSGFKKLPETIGCPDCADGGAEWIEITDGEGVKKVTFEFMKNVPEISNLIAEMRKARESMNNCE